jgi:3-deoxy-7-phosphoheptulonate synthase
MKTRDLRIESIRPLVSPAILLEEIPLSEEGSVVVTRGRTEVSRILSGTDDRLVAVVGPCSIHDTEAALDYATRLKAQAERLAADLCIVMRVYFEKPRTTVGWKGLINDPHLDSSFRINEGLRQARSLLVQLAEMGLPAGCEFLDPITPQFIADAVSWGAIGARTTESQVHRELASGLSMPVGFKNGTGGSIQLALDAVYAAAYPHVFLSVTEQGVAAIVTTQGNADCHIILRGGKTGPNYGSEAVGHALTSLHAAGLNPHLMIDSSHGNSNKDHLRQPFVVRDVAEQVASGQTGIFGVLLESFIVPGKQEFTDTASLVYGQSITDSCMGWDVTVEALEELAAAVRARRARAGAGAASELPLAAAATR